MSKIFKQNILSTLNSNEKKMFASIAEKMIISCNNLPNFKNKDEFSNYIGTTKNDLPFGLGGGRESQFANKIYDNLSEDELSFLQNKL